VAVGTALLGGLNVADARAMAPSWGQDLAFFHQIVHSAASGGPWASPLLLEPQGFFEMVHTHLVLPAVVGVYRLWPHQEVLLVFQGLFAGLALWPAFRLAETAAAESGAGRPAAVASVASLSLLLLGPLQAVGTCDFRPSVLFLPGVLGVFSAARRDRVGSALAWAVVANLGRQEAAYLLAAASIALILLPWGPLLPGRRSRRRWRTGVAVLLFAAISFGAWVLVKPQMFFHFNPTALPDAAVLAPEHVEARWRFLGRAALAVLPTGLLAPTGLLGMLPLAVQMARDGREWTELVGATAHYHAPWLAFALASALAGAMRWPRRLGGAWLGAALLAAPLGLSFPWPAPRQGPVELRRLTDQVPADARVAADYDTIHAVAGRAVLWNSAQLLQPVEERPLAFSGSWPLTLDDVDVILVREGEPLAHAARAAGWTVADGVPFQGSRELLLTAP